MDVQTPGARIDRAAAIATALRAEIGRVIVGQEPVVDQLLCALFAGGHVLFQGVPGLAKTLLVQSLAQATACSFSRVQFTPDLMPSDITGTEVLEEDRTTGRRESRFLPGPLFAQLVLADEVNRTPPRTQAALLQAMQERRVTAGGRTWTLPEPFFVFATQNPVEQEGTWSLPEAQLDRFMFLIEVDYPSRDEELRIVERSTGAPPPALVARAEAADLLDIQNLVREVPVGPELVALAVDLVRATRPGEGGVERVRQQVQWGAGPRATQHLVLAAKARALLHGRGAPTRADLHALAPAVLAHRIVLGFRAAAEGVRGRDVVAHVLDCVDGSRRL